MICAVALCLLSTAWIYVSNTTRLHAEMTMRRQIQTFEERLKSTVRASSPEYRTFLTQTNIITNKNNEVVILGALPPETFEEMRLRVTNPLLFPTWPGVVALVIGLVCAVTPKFSANATNVA